MIDAVRVDHSTAEHFARPCIRALRSFNHSSGLTLGLAVSLAGRLTIHLPDSNFYQASKQAPGVLLLFIVSPRAPHHRVSELALHVACVTANSIVKKPVTTRPSAPRAAKLTVRRRHAWINYAACVWALLFAAPHIWWALGISAGFPGGEAKYRFFISSTWRYVFDLVVILLAALAVLVALTLSRSRHRSLGRSLTYVAAWIACGMLTLRGVAGFIHDGFSDRIWNPTFLIGGILFGSVAWLAHKDSPARDDGKR